MEKLEFDDGKILILRDTDNKVNIIFCVQSDGDISISIKNNRGNNIYEAIFEFCTTSGGGGRSYNSFLQLHKLKRLIQQMGEKGEQYELIFSDLHNSKEVKRNGDMHYKSELSVFENPDGSIILSITGPESLNERIITTFTLRFINTKGDGYINLIGGNNFIIGVTSVIIAGLLELKKGMEMDNNGLKKNNGLSEYDEEEYF